jgi:hypothetical protein
VIIDKSILRNASNDLTFDSVQPSSRIRSVSSPVTKKVICVSRPKIESFSLESGFSSRGAAEA